VLLREEFINIRRNLLLGGRAEAASLAVYESKITFINSIQSIFKSLREKIDDFSHANTS
jgi:hypothetical protein